MENYHEDLLARENALQGELREVKDELTAIAAQECFELHGIRVGSEVRSRDGKTIYIIDNVRPSGKLKPTLSGRKKKKNGEWSKFSCHCYLGMGNNPYDIIKA